MSETPNTDGFPALRARGRHARPVRPWVPILIGIVLALGVLGAGLAWLTSGSETFVRAGEAPAGGSESPSETPEASADPPETPAEGDVSVRDEASGLVPPGSPGPGTEFPGGGGPETPGGEGAAPEGGEPSASGTPSGASPSGTASAESTAPATAAPEERRSPARTEEGSAGYGGGPDPTESAASEPREPTPEARRTPSEESSGGGSSRSCGWPRWLRC